MSILSVANVHFEVTASNRIDYDIPNTTLRIVTSNDLNVNPGSGNAIVNGTLSATNFNSSSDANLKKDIETLENALDKLDAIRGVTFKWKNNDRASMGVIAQEVELTAPELINENNGFKGVNYGGLMAILIESIKELKIRIEKLENNK